MERVNGNLQEPDAVKFFTHDGVWGVDKSGSDNK